MNFEDYETLPTNNVGTHMIAGAIAGIMEHCVMYPLDSVKVSETIRQPDNSSATDGPKDKKCHWPVLRLSRPQVQLVTSE